MKHNIDNLLELLKSAAMKAAETQTNVEFAIPIGMNKQVRLIVAPPTYHDCWTELATGEFKSVSQPVAPENVRSGFEFVYGEE